MPLAFPFRRKQSKKVPRAPQPNNTQLRAELEEAVLRLTKFSESLRRELDIADAEEKRLNPTGEEH